MPRIILASQSPRRRQLLGQIGVEEFEILVPKADESYDSGWAPEEVVAAIFRRKGEAARALAGKEAGAKPRAGLLRELQKLDECFKEPRSGKN